MSDGVSTGKVVWIALLTGGAATLGGFLIKTLLDRRGTQADHVQFLGPVDPGPSLDVVDVVARYGVDLRSLRGRVDGIDGRVSSLERRVGVLENAGQGLRAASTPPANGRSSGPAPGRTTMTPWTGPEEPDAAIRRFQLLELD